MGGSRGGRAPQKFQGAIPGQASCCRIVGLRAVRFKEPVSRARVAVERHRAAGALQGLLQRVDFSWRLKRIVLGEVTEVDGSKAAAFGAARSVRNAIVYARLAWSGFSLRASRRASAPGMVSAIWP
jgi:hypothetical protein